MFNIQKSAPAPAAIIVPRHGGKGRPAAYGPKRVYTPAEIKDLLEGYSPAPPDTWDRIPHMAHVRYIKKDGTFVRGGFLTNHWARGGKKFFHLASGFNAKAPGYATWPVAHESLGKLYKKNEAANAEVGAMRGKTAEMIQEINKLVDVAKAQKRQIDALERDIAILFAALKLKRPPPSRPSTPGPPA